MTASQEASPHIEMVSISPALARVLLEGNRHNRNLRRTRVRELASAMDRNEWELNGETIKLSADGTLIDGQHRLEAVLASGATIDTLIVRGLPIDAQDEVDTGRKRLLADALAIESYPDARALAAALNLLHRVRASGTVDAFGFPMPTTQQALALVEREPEIVGSVRAARNVTKAIGGPFGVFAVLHYLFLEVDPEPAEEFFKRLRDGAALARTDPILHLRNHLVRPSFDRTYKQSTRQVAAMTVKAFNQRRARKRVTVLAYRSTEAFPVIDAAKVSR